MTSVLVGSSMSALSPAAWTRSPKTLTGLALLAPLVFLAHSGCARPAVTPNKGGIAVVEQRDDSLHLALELFRQAQDLPQFREALNHVSAPLAKHAAKASLPLDDKTRQLVQELCRPEADEMAEIDAGAVQPLDAAYLESSFLFREAARALEITGLPLREQAALGFGWAMRRVMLHEQQDEGLPPHLILRRGFGSVGDRGVVALEVLRQAQLLGCIVPIPIKEGRDRLLIGVLLPKKEGADLLLFDPRLGLPVPGPQGQGIATLAEVRAQPELLTFSGIAPDQLKDAAARSGYPLPALAPRMKALEDLLSGQERVFLHHDLAIWQRHLAAAGLPPAPWPAQASPAPPRAFRLFYPPEEGGIDKRQRYAHFKLLQAPLPPAIYKLQEMRLFAELPDDARIVMTNFLGDLFEKYYLQPRAALLRGQHEAVLKRIDRIGSVIEQADAAAPIAESQFQQAIAQWRERLNEAYLSQDEGRVKQFWSEDQHVLALLQVDDPVPPQKYQRKMLTYILLRACRATLGNHVEALKAACWEDKAAKLQVQWDERRQAGKELRGIKDDAQSAWRNTRSAWANFLDRADVNPSQVRSRLEPIAFLWNQGQKELALGLWDQLHLDVHRALEARVRLAEANHRLGQTPLAKAALAKLRDDVAALTQQEQPRKLLQECLDQVRDQPTGTHAKRLELLARDWTPDGTLASFHDRVARLLAAWK
jgi:hypothetical protein